MKKEQKKSSGFPLAVIALVFIVVVVGGIWFYNTSRTALTGANTAANSPSAARTPFVPANAPMGAPIGINMIGSPDAVVTVEEFADFQCGACASVHPVMKELQAAYAGNRNFRFIFRHFPLAMHDKAYDAAAAVEAAGLQGKFWQMQDQLFRNQRAWVANPNYRDLWIQYAGEIGMDVERFRNDAAGLQTKQRVDLDLGRGRALNVSSTPTIFINGQSVPFPEMNTASMRRLIDAEIQRASAAAANAKPAAASNSQTAPTAPAANSANTAGAANNPSSNSAANIK
jgi:protein-disulfide isomerase